MHHPIFQWAIVGAGPAGIAAIGKLLDAGIDPKRILWIDPFFKVGDLGRLWRTASSNTTIQLFRKFLLEAHSFSYQQAPIDFQINHLPPEETCVLECIVEPLQWITDRFCKMVHVQQTKIHQLSLSNRVWSLQDDTHTFQAENVVLATGAEPKRLHYPNVATIPLDIAMNKILLRKNMNQQDTFAIFGSSHSAILIIKDLVDLGAKRIINFYLSPCRYAVNMGDWILFDNTGLKGQTAQWAREHIDGVRPPQLERYIGNESNIAHHLPQCDKAIYAVGFNGRHDINIEHHEHHYNPHVGIIAPGLFGLGIAYPEIKPDCFGNIETQVGLWKFMNYLNKVLPIWFKYHT